MKILAAIDPGSKRTAIIIARHEPGIPLALLHSRILDVGADVVHPEPIHHPATDTRKAWIETRRHVVTREHEQTTAQAIVADLLRYGADSVLLESVEYVHGDTAQNVSQTAHHIAIAERILSAIHAMLAAVAVETVYTPRTRWFAALQRHVSAGLVPGIGRIPKKMGKAGRPLDPLLRAYLPALPLLVEAKGGADYRDAAGLLLSAVIGELPVPVVAPAAPERPRAPRKARGKTPRALLSPEVHAALLAAERAKREPATTAAREARGCTCGPGPGRCPRTCPAWRPMKYRKRKRERDALAGYKGPRETWY